MGESFLALARFQGLGGRLVERVSKALLFPIPLRGLPAGLTRLVEAMSEAFFLLERALLLGLLRPGLRDARAVVAEPIAQLLHGELCPGPADGHGVEPGAVPVLVGEDGLAGGGQHLGRFAPSGPGVETGDGKAAFPGMAFEGSPRPIRRVTCTARPP